MQCTQGLSKDQPVVEGKHSALCTWKLKIVFGFLSVTFCTIFGLPCIILIIFPFFKIEGSTFLLSPSHYSLFVLHSKAMARKCSLCILSVGFFFLKGRRRRPLLKNKSYKKIIFLVLNFVTN